MCHKLTTTYLLCQHKHQITDRCLLDRQSQPQPQPRCNFLTHLLCGRTTPPPPRCVPVALTRSAEKYCAYCLLQQNNLRPSQPQAQPQAETQNLNPSHRASEASEVNLARSERSLTRAEARIVAAKSRAERRRGYKCSLCRFEDRPIPREARNANGGFCCARGIEEFEAGEKRRYRSGSNQVLESEAPKMRRSENVTGLRRGVTVGGLGKRRDASSRVEVVGRSVTIDIREAREAVYGWAREAEETDDATDARVVQEMLNIPGSLTSAAGDLKKPLPPLPFEEPPFAAAAREKFGYAEPGVDWNWWKESPQTAHGRYPRLNSAPQGPLPKPPASNARPYLKAAAGGSTEMHPLRRRTASNNLKERTKRSRFRVSPLGSPIRGGGEPVSPVSPVNNSRFDKLERDGGLLRADSQSSARLAAWRNARKGNGKEEKV